MQSIDQAVGQNIGIVVAAVYAHIFIRGQHAIAGGQPRAEFVLGIELAEQEFFHSLHTATGFIDMRTFREPVINIEL